MCWTETKATHHHVFVSWMSKLTINAKKTPLKRSLWTTCVKNTHVTTIGKTSRGKPSLDKNEISPKYHSGVAFKNFENYPARSQICVTARETRSESFSSRNWKIRVPYLIPFFSRSWSKRVNSKIVWNTLFLPWNAISWWNWRGKNLNNGNDISAPPQPEATARSTAPDILVDSIQPNESSASKVLPFSSCSCCVRQNDEKNFASWMHVDQEAEQHQGKLWNCA